MQKKTAIAFGVGCGGIALLVVIIGVIAALLAPKMLEWGEQQIALEQERKAIADSWQPPAEDVLLEQFFPAEAAGYEFISQDENATIPEFHFDHDGRHATYQSGDSRIDVFVFRVTEQEKDALVQQVDDVYEEQEKGFKMKNKRDYRMYFSSSQHHQNHFWWTKGWMFVFRTDDSEDREPFVIKFLQETSA